MFKTSPYPKGRNKENKRGMNKKIQAGIKVIELRMSGY
jgi:hypothetical protein